MAPLNPEYEPVNENVNELPASREDKIALMGELFQSGKRCYNLGELFDASDKLAQAAEIGVGVYGEMAPELFEIHYYYGQALLGIASMESNVVENAVQNLEVADETANDETVQDETIECSTLSESQIAEIEKNVADALTENAFLLEKAQLPEEESAAVETMAPLNSAEVEFPTIKEPEGEPVDVPEEQEDHEVEDEEPSSLQLAWEVLEVARTICEKQDESKEWDLKKADVLTVLANCSVEEAQYKQAIEDLSNCLAIQQKHCDADDRRIAATYFEMGRVFKLNDQFDLAAEHLIHANEIVKSRINTLVGKMSTADVSVKNLLSEELEDLKGLLPELKEKINDAKESAQDAKLKEAVEVPATKQANFEDALALEANPAADITNLVRKSTKRIAETGDNHESKKVKFAKAEDGENLEVTML